MDLNSIVFTIIKHPNLENVEVGDEVTRDMHGITMNLKVTKVTDTKIYCGPWEFNKKTGAEIDEDISGIVSYIYK
jgi:hypothetical protein